MIGTKIIATIGPACDSYDLLKQLHEAGMNVARLNFSHGSHEYFEKIIRRIRRINPSIALMLDTKGPEIRLGEVENGEITICERDHLILTTQKVIGTQERITINYHKFESIAIGSLVLIDDGLIEGKVTKKGKNMIQIKILNGGQLGSYKSITFKGQEPHLTFLSDQDKKDLLFGIKHEVDFIAASYVKNCQDTKSIQTFLKKRKSKAKVISKIEHWKALENLDNIIKQSGGVMIARGDLGIEIDMERIPKVQKEIIAKCNELGRPVIVATQMLESMRDNPLPTRAEVADVAQAILQGTDAVMLSAETATGRFPLKAVKQMKKIAQEYDKQVEKTFEDDPITMKEKPVSTFITEAAYMASQELNTRAIITPTESGFTARKVSRFRPQCPIYAITKNTIVARQLELSWGVKAVVHSKRFCDHEEMSRSIISKLFKEKKLSRKDRVVITSGMVMGKSGHTNMLEIYYVKDIV